VLVRALLSCGAVCIHPAGCCQTFHSRNKPPGTVKDSLSSQPETLPYFPTNISRFCLYVSIMVNVPCLPLHAGVTDDGTLRYCSLRVSKLTLVVLPSYLSTPLRIMNAVAVFQQKGLWSCPLMALCLLCQPAQLLISEKGRRPSAGKWPACSVCKRE